MIRLVRKFPVCSIIRPTETAGAAMGAAKALTADGLFIGQTKQFFKLVPIWRRMRIRLDAKR